MSSRVVRVDRGSVVIDDGARLVSDGAAVIGDFVEHDGARVTSVNPRRGLLSRRRTTGDRDVGSSAQPIAANVDVVVIVDAFAPGLKPRRIERGVALANEADAMPLVVLNKADLADDADEQALDLQDELGVAVVALSAETGEGVDVLEAMLGEGQTAVLIGPSGIGKSTLLNRLMGEAVQATTEVREGDSKGRHTTVHRELFALPSGALLIDTPGTRELGLWASAEAVDDTFPEIDARADACRFRDCAHEGEPGCAVAAAVEAGEIDAARVESWRKLRREAARLVESVHERRAKDRAFGRMVHEAMAQKKR
jgi:ribosome biogenesis GTPase